MCYKHIRMLYKYIHLCYIHIHTYRHVMHIRYKYIYIYLHLHFNIYMYIYTYIYTYTHIYIYTCTQPRRKISKWIKTINICNLGSEKNNENNIKEEHKLPTQFNIHRCDTNEISVSDKQKIAWCRRFYKLCMPTAQAIFFSWQDNSDFKHCLWPSSRFCHLFSITAVKNVPQPSKVIGENGTWMRVNELL